MKHARSNRAGVTLVEQLVAIVLVLIVLAIGGGTIQRLLATTQRTALTDTRRAAIADALHTLRRHVGSADPTVGDLRAVSDSVLELVHDIGMTTVCRVTGDTLVVTSGPDTVPWASTLPRAITLDDRVRIWHDRDERWVARQVRSATPAGGVCGDSSLAWPATGTQQLVLDSAANGIRPGVVVRVEQQERWSTVRGSDGIWSLSQSTWDAARQQYTTAQPLLSPLAAPTARGGPGLHIGVTDEHGHVLADSQLTHARLVHITLRLASAARLPAIADSVRIDVGAR